MHFSPSGWLTLRKFVEFIQSWLSVEPFPFSSVLKSLFKWFIWWLISDKHLIPFNNLHKYLGSTPADTPVQQEPGDVGSQRILRGALSQRRPFQQHAHALLYYSKNKELPWDSLAGKMEPRRRVTSQVSGESLGLAAKRGSSASQGWVVAKRKQVYLERYMLHR